MRTIAGTLLLLSALVTGALGGEGQDRDDRDDGDRDEQHERNGGIVVAIVSPTDGSTVPGPSLDVTVQFSVHEGHVRVLQLLLDGAVIDTFENDQKGKAGSHTFTVDLSTRDGQSLTFVARARRGSVHSKKFTDSASVTVQVGHALPIIQVAIVSPVFGDVLTGSTADVTVTFANVHVIELLLNDVVVSTFNSPSSSGTFTFTGIDVSALLGQVIEFSVRGIDGADVITVLGTQVLVNDPANPPPPDTGLVFSITKSEKFCTSCSGPDVTWNYTMTKPTIKPIAPITGTGVTSSIQARIQGQYVAIDGSFDEGRDMKTGAALDLSTSLQVNASVEFGSCVTSHTNTKLWSASGGAFVRTVAFTATGNALGFGSPYSSCAAKATNLAGSDLSYSAEKGVESGEKKLFGIGASKIVGVTVDVTVADGTTTIKPAANAQQKDFDKETFFLNTQSNAGTIMYGTGGPLLNGHAFCSAVAECYHTLVLRGKTTVTLDCMSGTMDSTFFVRTNDNEDPTVPEDQKPWAGKIDGASATIEQGIPLTRQFGQQADADSDGNGDKTASDDKVNLWFPRSARVPAFE